MAKITDKKTSVVSALSDLVSRSKSIAVVDYTGMKVSQVTQLRKDLKKVGGQMVVTKNTLFKIAANQTDLKLEGISAFVFSTTDEVSVAKVIADFSKKNTVPTFKMGFLGTRVLTASEVTALATTPDRTTSYQLLTTRLNSPLFKLTYSLNWNLSKLVRTLDAVRAKKA